jgi:hypothetical protein
VPTVAFYSASAEGSVVVKSAAEDGGQSMALAEHIMSGRRAVRENIDWNTRAVQEAAQAAAAGGGGGGEGEGEGEGGGLVKAVEQAVIHAHSVISSRVNAVDQSTRYSLCSVSTVLPLLIQFNPHPVHPAPKAVCRMGQVAHY